MRNIKELSSWKFSGALKWVLLVFALAYIALVFARTVQMIEKDKTEAQVAKIHATKLTLADVMGENLPPDPGEAADDTVAGIDANANGIRDDVELAIFREYPDSPKTRAPLLQYALALQMGAQSPLINTIVVTEIVTEEGRANTCIADTLVPTESSNSERAYSDIEEIERFMDFVENNQFNTDNRQKRRDNFLGYLRSFGDSTNKICDIDVEKL